MRNNQPHSLKFPRILRSAVLGALMVFASGCVDVEQRLILDPDGSGTLRIKHEVSEPTVKRIKSMLSLSDELASVSGTELPPLPADDFTYIVFDPTRESVLRKINSYKHLGVELIDYKFFARGGKRTVEFVAKFNDLEKLAQADFFASYGFSLVKSKNGNYVFYTRPAITDEFNSSWDFRDPNVVKMIAPFLQDFRFHFTLQLPGDVLKTNAHRQSYRTLEWRYEFGEDPYALTRLQRDQLTAVFRSNGLSIPEVRQVPAVTESGDTQP